MKTRTITRTVTVRRDSQDTDDDQRVSAVQLVGTELFGYVGFIKLVQSPDLTIDSAEKIGTHAVIEDVDIYQVTMTAPAELLKGKRNG